MNAFDSVISKALTDVNFCNALLANPEQELRKQGVEPSDEMIEALSNLDAATLQKLAAALSKEQVAS